MQVFLESIQITAYGHRSIEALRQYERTSTSQLMEISKIMSHGSKVCNNNSTLWSKAPIEKHESSKICNKSTLSSKAPIEKGQSSKICNKSTLSSKAPNEKDDVVLTKQVCTTTMCHLLRNMIT